MKYTEYGLQVTLTELKNLVERVEREAKYNSMETCIYIKGGEQPQITQYCNYAECFPVNHTCGVR